MASRPSSFPPAAMREPIGTMYIEGTGRLSAAFLEDCVGESVQISCNPKPAELARVFCPDARDQTSYSLTKVSQVYADHFASELTKVVGGNIEIHVAKISGYHVFGS